jgi:hypothetical protein
MTIKIKSDGNIFFSLVLMILISFATRDYKFFLCGYERDARTIGGIFFGKAVAINVHERIDCFFAGFSTLKSC